MAEDLIRDHVFPIVEARGDPRSGSMAFTRLRGTGFRVGEGVDCLTAAHVVRDPADLLVALFVEGDRWGWRLIKDVEFHPVEDVALVRLEDAPKVSFLWPGAVDVRSSFPCDVWGYPDSVLYEVVEGDRAHVRPDLVFATGHVRRTRSPGDFLPQGFASVVAELDFVGGGGCSGAPVIGRQERGSIWQVAGIYLGEQRTHEGDRFGFFIPYSTVRDWASTKQLRR